MYDESFDEWAVNGRQIEMNWGVIDNNGHGIHHSQSRGHRLFGMCQKIMRNSNLLQSSSDRWTLSKMSWGQWRWLAISLRAWHSSVRHFETFSVPRSIYSWDHYHSWARECQFQPIILVLNIIFFILEIFSIKLNINNLSTDIRWQVVCVSLWRHHGIFWHRRFSHTESNKHRRGNNKSRQQHFARCRRKKFER